MPEIGIRELKSQASEIVRAVREGRVEYVITHRGRPVAMIVPFEEASEETMRSHEAFWDEMDALADELAATWDAEKSPLEYFFEQRRQS